MTLTTTQNTKLAGALDALERRVRDDTRATLLESGDQRHVELAGMVHDVGDESVANMLIDLDSTLVERHLQELREIEDARRRWADGSIDCCIECGGDIGYQRLLAHPIALRCVACQSQHEKTHAREGTPRL